MQNFNINQCVIKYGYENIDFIKVPQMLSKAFWSLDIKIEFIYSNISPMKIKFKRCSCFDVEVNYGGFGQIVLELSVIKKENFSKD